VFKANPLFDIRHLDPTIANTCFISSYADLLCALARYFAQGLVNQEPKAVEASFNGASNCLAHHHLKLDEAESTAKSCLCQASKKGISELAQLCKSVNLDSIREKGRKLEVWNL
jgi:hypothetical protein